MSDQVNKELLIAVMSKRQAELEKMVRLQADQLNNYRDHVEGFEMLVGKYQQDAAAIEKTLEQYKQLDESQKQKQAQLAEMFEAMVEENNKLTTELEELKKYVQQLEQKVKTA
jgi:chromosome segregation ATPase